MEKITQSSVKRALSLLLDYSKKYDYFLMGKYNNKYTCFMDSETRDMFIIIPDEDTTRIKIIHGNMNGK